MQTLGWIIPQFEYRADLRVRFLFSIDPFICDALRAYMREPPMERVVGTDGAASNAESAIRDIDLSIVFISFWSTS